MSISLSPILALDRTACVTLADCYSPSVFWAQFEDATGRRAVVCLDCRPGSPTQNRIFDQARHPNKQGAVLIELGAEAEGIAVALLSRFLDSESPTQMGLSDEFVELFQPALLHLGDPLLGSEG